MRTITLPLALAAVLAHAQQPMVGLYEQAPDFTATDMNGGVHTLQSYLDDGYTVILDFIVPWCEPCVELHESGVLHTLYNTYGPASGSTDRKIMVFMVTYTGIPYLDGGQTIDFVSGTPYPILKHTPILDAYGVMAFPRVLTICPSGMVVSTQSSTVLANMLDACVACEHYTADSPNDATLLPAEDPGCLLETDDRHVPLYNVGTAALTAVSIEAVDCFTNDVLSTTTWTGTLATYEQTLVTLPGWSAPPGERCVRYRIATPDDDAVNDVAPDIYYQAPVGTSATSTVTVEVLTDANGAGWTWYLYGSDGQTAAFVQEGEYAANTFYTRTVELDPNLCWHFGIANWTVPSFQAPGYYRVISGGEVLIDETNTTQLTGGAVLHDAYFISGLATAIGETSVATPELRVTGAGLLNITRAVDGSTLQVLDGAGRLIMQERIAGTSATVDLSGLTSGAYIAALTSNAGRYARTIVITP